MPEASDCQHLEWVSNGFSGVPIDDNYCGKDGMFSRFTKRIVQEVVAFYYDAKKSRLPMEINFKTHVAV